MTPQEALNVLDNHCCEEAWAEETDEESRGLCGGPYLCPFRRIGSRESQALDVLRKVVGKAK